MATLKDIADAVGVSVRTVSRALADGEYVKAEVRTRIREVAADLGYAPNPIARSLRLGRTREVVVVAVTVDELHMARIAGLEQTLRESGYSTGIQMVREPEIDQPASLIAALSLRRPAAVAIAGRAGLSVEPLVAALRSQGVKTVVMDGEGPGPVVRIDRAAGVAQAVHHLHSRGRRRIVYVGPEDSRDRIEGCERALAETGLPVRIFAPAGEYRAAVRSLLDRYPDVDALQAYSDERALELLAGLHDAGVRVPDDIAVVGFDDRWAARYAWPTLTTVAQPSGAVGAAAARFLIDPDRENCDERIPTRLVVRESG